MRMVGANDIQAPARPFARNHIGPIRPVCLRLGYHNYALRPDETAELARQLLAAVVALRA